MKGVMIETFSVLSAVLLGFAVTTQQAHQRPSDPVAGKTDGQAAALDPRNDKVAIPAPDSSVFRQTTALETGTLWVLSTDTLEPAAHAGRPSHSLGDWFTTGPLPGYSLNLDDEADRHTGLSCVLQSTERWRMASNLNGLHSVISGLQKAEPGP